MKVVLYLSLTVFPFLGFSQFTGGQGDGYSGLDVTLEPTSVKTVNSSGYGVKSIYSKNETVVLEKVDRVELTGLKGQTILVSEDEQFEIPSSIQVGIYILTVYNGQNVIRQRVYVKE